MVPQFSEDASARIAKARAAADRRYHKNKRELPPLSAPDWDEAVRDLCAYYTLDICIAEVKEFTASSYPLHEIQAFLDHRVEELTQEVMHSPKWPAEGHLDKRMHRLIREVNLRRHIDFIKSSPQWKRWQSRIFGTRKSALAVALKPQAEALTRVAGGFPQANQAGATEPSGDESVRMEAAPAESAPLPRDGDRTNPVATERKELYRTFKAKAKSAGIEINEKKVAKAANPKWNDRTMIAWWKRNDPRCKQPHDRMIRAVLTRDPSAVWPQE